MSPKTIDRIIDKQTYFSTVYQIEEYGFFGMSGLLGELVLTVDDDLEDDDKVDIPLSGERGDRFSSLP